MNFQDVENKVENINNLEELFELWTIAHSLEENDDTKSHKIIKDSFVKDGYIGYDKAKFNGILFVLKEANIAEYAAKEYKKKFRDDQRIWYRNYIDNIKKGNKSGDNHPKQLEKLGRIVHYILTEEIKNNYDFVKSLENSAFMNLNKRGGDRQDKTSDKYTEKYFKFIQKEIDIINPNIIICIGTYNILKKYLLQFNYYNEKTIINMWHTAYGMQTYKRTNKYGLDDLNVDLYLEEFVKRYNNIRENYK